MNEGDNMKKKGDAAWTDLGAEPSSASTEDNVDDSSDPQADISEENEFRKGTWTLEEDRELSRLIEVCNSRPRSGLFRWHVHHLNTRSWRAA